MSQRPIKIMQIIARLNIGGPAVHVILLAEHFKAPAYESLLVCGQIDPTEGDMRYLADAKGIQPVIIPQLGRNISFLRDGYTIWQLYRLIRQHRPDIVHTHTAKAGFVGRLAAWLAGVPVRLHTFHGHVFHGYFGKRKTQLFLALERLCARLSTRIITISPTLRDELADTYRIAPRHKFAVLPLGMDLEPLSQTDSPSNFRESYHLPSAKKLIGIVGRLVPIKNHELFLRVASHILTQRSDLHFVIVGDGETRPAMEQLANALGITQNVSFLGWIQDLRPVLQELDVMALTSHNEGTPVSLIEAMAAGVPIVATAVGGVADVLENGKLGTLVLAGDGEKLAEALQNAADGHHPDVKFAQQVALQKYGLNPQMEALAALYQTLLHEKDIT